MVTQGVRTGQREYRPYTVELEYFEQRFDYARASSRLVFPLWFFGLAAYLARRAVAEKAIRPDHTSQAG